MVLGSPVDFGGHLGGKLRGFSTSPTSISYLFSFYVLRFCVKFSFLQESAAEKKYV